MEYTVVGLVDGRCGHLHKTLESAEQCRMKYQAQHPYSDRCVRYCVDGSTKDTRLLDMHATIDLQRVHDRLRKELR